MKPTPIDAERVAAAVGALGLHWHYRDVTGSTNADALAGYHQDGRQRVVFAERQTAGRGRRGRAWLSPPGANLYCTVGLCKPMPAASQGLLSIVTGIALAAVLGRQCDGGVGLKWPNDLLTEQGKLGGILIESRADGAAGPFYAIGFGINLFMSDADLASIEQRATSLERIAAQPPNRTDTLLNAISAVVDAVRAFNPAETDRLTADFHRLDRLHQREVVVLRGSERLHGVNRGINARGELLLDTGRAVEALAAGEISLREAAP